MSRLLTRTRRGFTWVELIVVLAMLGVVVGMLVPAVQQVRAAAARMSCSNNIKQLNLSMQNYASTYQDELPPITSATNSEPPSNLHGAPIHFALIPYLEAGPLYKIGTPQPNSVWNATDPAIGGKRLLTVRIKPYVCPADITLMECYPSNRARDWAGTSYAANYQLFGPVHSGNADMPLYKIGEIPDGT